MSNTKRQLDAMNRAQKEIDLFNESQAKHRQVHDDKNERWDGFVNAISGIGTSQDRTSFNQWQVTNVVQNLDAYINMFRCDDMIRRATSVRPREATRQGWQVAVAGDKDVLVADQKRLKVVKRFQEAMTWANVVGGSIIVVGARDGLEPQEPVNENSIDAIDWLKVVDARYVQPGPIDDDVTSERFGQPSYYDFLIPSSTKGQIRIHASRVIRFDGVLTPDDKRQENRGWDDSLILAMLQAVSDFEQSFRSTSIMMSEAVQGVFKIKDFISMVAENDQETLAKRTQLMNICRSVARAIVVDADEESFDRSELSFGGVALILDRMMMRLSAAVEIPVTILMGRSPAGQNATGDADFRYFYDTIRTQQADDIEPNLQELFKLMLLAKTINKPTDDIAITFNSLWQQTPAEQADTYLKFAQADGVYIDRMVLLPEEVALSRFTADGFGLTIEIDRELREKQATPLEDPEVKETTEPTEPTEPVEGAAGTFVLAPTDIATVVTVNEARKQSGLSPWHDPEEGKLTLTAFKALVNAAAPIIGEAEAEKEVKLDGRIYRYYPIDPPHMRAA